jgi:hypothetical protein
MPSKEVTPLNPQEEAQFQIWAKSTGIQDVDHPDSHYDYRGYWKELAGKQHTGSHFPDTYKQHGHPTFSVESKYSSGRWDGGRWINEQYVPPGADFLVNSRGQSRLPASELEQALLERVTRNE